MAQHEIIENERIVQTPEVMVGKPVIKGTRIPVEVVLEYLARNPNFDDLFADYPRLTMDDVKAVLAYARTALEHQQEKPEPSPPTNV